jgi:hypothetical protein
MALKQQNRLALGGNERTDCQSPDIQADVIQKPEVEIEMMESEPTIQQQQAYERFWNLFLERLLRDNTRHRYS